ncbi:MAG: hypothetical protein KBS57_00520, partial [Alistipes sp.]|nr:hypothetical protein [Candidatus Minthomonas equi]
MKKMMFATVALLFYIHGSAGQGNSAESFIRDFYQNARFEDEAFLKEHCSPALLSKLRREYDYDGDGYAVWLFRSGAQDGPDRTKNEVVSVEQEGDWYTYEAYDSGILFSRSVKLQPCGETFTILDVQGFTSLPTESFLDLTSEGTYVLLDVRTAEEYEEGHLDGALNIDVKKDDFSRTVSERIEKGSALAIYCRSGRRSKAAAKILSRMGFSGYELDQGYLSVIDMAKPSPLHGVLIHSHNDYAQQAPFWFAYALKA